MVGVVVCDDASCATDKCITLFLFFQSSHFHTIDPFLPVKHLSSIMDLIYYLITVAFYQLKKKNKTEDKNEYESVEIWM